MRVLKLIDHLLHLAEKDPYANVVIDRGVLIPLEQCYLIERGKGMILFKEIKSEHLPLVQEKS